MAASENPVRVAREIPVRTPELAFDRDLPHHWLAGNAIATHVFNGLNLVFPDGERFFIRSVRACADADLDEGLRREIRAFNGQEGRHAHEHERYFEVLEAQGYEIRGFLRFFQGALRWTDRLLPAPLRLAITAGAEHYTATFGAFAFEDPLLDEAPEPMRRLILWHAAEEIEHKHVAFDVLQARHPSVWLRRLGYVLATIDLFGFSLLALRMLVRQDLRAGRVTREELRAQRQELRARQAAFAPALRARVRAYWRRDFHPGETDERPRAHARLAELGIA